MVPRTLIPSGTLLIWYPATTRVHGRFQEESEPSETVEQLAGQMLPSQLYDDLHILKGPYVMEDWDPELIKVCTAIVALPFFLFLSSDWRVVVYISFWQAGMRRGD